jgi:hypothetical protein
MALWHVGNYLEHEHDGTIQTMNMMALRPVGNYLDHEDDGTQNRR